MSTDSHYNNDETLDDALADIRLEKRLADIKFKIIVLSGISKSTVAAYLAMNLALTL